ncbi:MAG: DUF1492 domain-containing protein [Defluviitaleaceae bacterium]|nr:DUF1492 domain-containing protein [Defluviitaleaceae bacterium]
MGTGSHFSNVFALENRITKLSQRIGELRAMQLSSGSISRSGSVQKSRNYSHIEDLSIAILETEEELTKTKMSLIELETDIRRISRVLQSPISRAIITWRYICRLKWKDIADRTELSEMQAIRKHNIAITYLENDNSKLTKPVAN